MAISDDMLTAVIFASTTWYIVHPGWNAPKRFARVELLSFWVCGTARVVPVANPQLGHPERHARGVGDPGDRLAERLKSDASITPMPKRGAQLVRKHECGTRSGIDIDLVTGYRLQSFVAKIFAFAKLEKKLNILSACAVVGTIPF